MLKRILFEIWGRHYCHTFSKEATFSIGLFWGLVEGLSVVNSKVYSGSSTLFPSCAIKAEPGPHTLHGCTSAFGNHGDGHFLCSFTHHCRKISGYIMPCPENENGAKFKLIHKVIWWRKTSRQSKHAGSCMAAAPALARFATRNAESRAERYRNWSLLRTEAGRQNEDNCCRG